MDGQRTIKVSILTVAATILAAVLWTISGTAREPPRLVPGAVAGHVIAVDTDGSLLELDGSGTAARMLVSGDDNGEQSNNFVERAQQNNGSLVYQWCCDRAGARRSAPLRTRTGMTLAADASRWALSPDGSTVAVVVPGRSTIDLVRVADGSHRRLWKGDTDDEVVEFVGWESDGTHLRAAVLGGTTQFRWIRIDAQTGRVATVPASYVPNGYAIPVNGRAALLPNGRLLQLLPRDDANVSVAEVDVTTGAAIVLVSLNRTDTQSETYSVAIDHDGTHALVSSHRGIFEIDLATRRARLISHTPLTGASFVDG